MNTALKPQTGTWILTAPNGKQWQADSPLKACGAEQRERVPAEVGLSRLFAATAQPEQPARIQGLMEIILEAAAIINAIDPAYAPANIRWPIVDELDGFSLMLASNQKAQP